MKNKCKTYRSLVNQFWMTIREFLFWIIRACKKITIATVLYQVGIYLEEKREKQNKNKEKFFL
jgi:hypothetical protein